MTCRRRRTWLRKRRWFGAVIRWSPGSSGSGASPSAAGTRCGRTLVGADHLVLSRGPSDREDGGIYNYKASAMKLQAASSAGTGTATWLCNPPYYASVSPDGYSFYELPDLDQDRRWPPRAPRSCFLNLSGRFAFPVGTRVLPVFATVSFGQNTFISLAIFAAVYRLLESDRASRRGDRRLLWFKPQLCSGSSSGGRSSRSCSARGAVSPSLVWCWPRCRGSRTKASQAFVDSLRSNGAFSGRRCGTSTRPGFLRDARAAFHPGSGAWRVSSPERA